MPKINTEMDMIDVTGGIQFSAAKIENLGASEYTLVGIACDASSSVLDFVNEMTSCIKQVVESCQNSPRKENLMLRLTKFSYDVNEIHGFKELSAINSSDYDGCINPYGMTALSDASYQIIASVLKYAEMLDDQDYTANGIVFVITDGVDNHSKLTPSRTKELLENAMRKEQIESITTILIGVGNDISDSYLTNFKNEAGFTQAINCGDANAKTLAKLAQFVSQSISSQSQALGSGGPSQSLSF